MKVKNWRKWYPRSWQERYGEEYEQLLEDLGGEEQLSWRHDLDIVQSGLLLRRFYPDGRRRILVAGVSILLAAIFGFGLGFGLHGSASKMSFVSIGPAGRIGTVIAPCFVQRLPGNQVLKNPRALAEAMAKARAHGSITCVPRIAIPLPPGMQVKVKGALITPVQSTAARMSAIHLS